MRLQYTHSMLNHVMSLQCPSIFVKAVAKLYNAMLDLADS